MLKDKYDLNDLIDIMALLRSGDGCPWDREQTHDSLKRYMIEETYEVLEVIDKKDSERLCDELGDLLLQVIFHAQISRGEWGIRHDRCHIRNMPEADFTAYACFRRGKGGHL